MSPELACVDSANGVENPDHAAMAPPSAIEHDGAIINTPELRGYAPTETDLLQREARIPNG